jgi:rRNA maturation endonuclease Nob1
MNQLILDSSAFIDYFNPCVFETELYTTSDVIDEIKDINSRAKLEKLRPFLKIEKASSFSYNAGFLFNLFFIFFKILCYFRIFFLSTFHYLTHNKNPKKIVTQFAKKTGDYNVLSSTDLGILSLAYEIEYKKNKLKNLRNEVKPVNIKIIKKYEESDYSNNNAIVNVDNNNDNSSDDNGVNNNNNNDSNNISNNNPEDEEEDGWEISGNNSNYYFNKNNNNKINIELNSKGKKRLMDEDRIDNNKDNTGENNSIKDSDSSSKVDNKDNNNNNKVENDIEVEEGGEEECSDDYCNDEIEDNDCLFILFYRIF